MPRQVIPELMKDDKVHVAAISSPFSAERMLFEFNCIDGINSVRTVSDILHDHQAMRGSDSSRRQGGPNRSGNCTLRGQRKLGDYFFPRGGQAAV